MRGRGQEDHAPFRVPSQFGQKLETLLLAPLRADARVRFVDDHEVRTAPGEAVATLVGLDVVEADDGEGIGVEQGLGERQAALQPGGGPGRDRGGLDAEAGLQLGDPLIDEMRRAQHGKGIDFAAIHELAQDEAALDCLPDADVVGDEDARRLKPKRHQQGNELVSARLEGQLGRRPERTCSAAEGQAQGVGQQRRLRLHGRRGVGGQIEARRLHRLHLEGRIEDDGVSLASGKRPEREDAFAGARQRDPLASARADQVARREVHRHRTTL